MGIISVPKTWTLLQGQNQDTASADEYLRCFNLRNNAFFGGMGWLQDLPDFRWLDVRHDTICQSVILWRRWSFLAIRA